MRHHDRDVWLAQRIKCTCNRCQGCIVRVIDVKDAILIITIDFIILTFIFILTCLKTSGNHPKYVASKSNIHPQTLRAKD